ncbi:hypothetical protein DFQ14_11085 [Halopolyspora algeriensis]|uniref:WXG100 family type VII secretion target n=1 Tax=Halopolyspora algeriensis TaxID=1500506 RepID=A0A368VHM5_9ACTN|nr:hypothetical protein [Halopolyspora algeriensis]RCW40758.1 hypothetical protein DFQ14_11085 [Halopolyspora algeriensis]TQM53323.1 hypothetical protein FHU43_2713 [Halopolyspora algeriensis]
MSQEGWSGIGYNPAPGSVAATGELAGKLNRTATYLRETYEVLNDVKNQSDVWQGEASKAFAERIEDLPTYLDNAHKSLDRASGHLRFWEENLSQYQNRAQTLEKDARAARGQVAETETALEKANANPAFNLAGQRFDTDAELQDAEQRLAQARAQADAAAKRAEQARTSLEEILRRAEKLKHEHEGTADDTARKIQAADDGLAPPEPGWWEQLVDWVAENAGFIGDIAGVVSAVAGSLAFIPVLAPIFGPIALAAGAVALAGHSLDMGLNWEEKSENKGAWAGLGADVAGLVPGIGAVTKGIDFAGDSVGLLSKSGQFCRGLGDDMQEASMVPKMAMESLGYSHVAETGAKVSQSFVNTVTQVPTVTEWVTPGETEKEEKRGAAFGALVGNALQVR